MPRTKYKKIDVYRQSNLPVTLENLDAYKREFAETYDGYVKDIGKLTQESMKELQPKVAQLEARLLRKYPQMEQWDWFESQKKWKELTMEYGPIAIVTSREGKLVYIIMDQL